MRKEKHDDKVLEVLSNKDSILSAIKAGAQQALIQHKQAGVPIVIAVDGKMLIEKPVSNEAARKNRVLRYQEKRSKLKALRADRKKQEAKKKRNVNRSCHA